MGTVKAQGTGETEGRLSEWLEQRLPGARALRVTVEGGGANGYSTEMIFFTASWEMSEDRYVRSYVARIEPKAHPLFLDADLEIQFRILDSLNRRTQVRVPKVIWFETDSRWLGARFFVMEALVGDVPADVPSYAESGWLPASPIEVQRRVWWSGIDAMVAAHRVDCREAGLDFLDDSTDREVPLTAHLAYWSRYLSWAAPGTPPQLLQDGLRWLYDHQPRSPNAHRLCWGDARLGNVMYQDGWAVGLLDWEMAVVGDPLQDLCWWNFMDRCFTEGLGLKRLPGFPSYGSTISHWVEGTGLAADAADLSYYEIYAAVRFAAILVRHATRMKANGVLPPDADLASNNMATGLLETLLAR